MHRLGVINMEEALRAELSLYKPHCLELEIKTRIYYLQGADDEDIQSWLVVLKQVIEYFHPKSI